MQTTRPVIRRLLAPLRLLALLFVACHLGQETRVEDTLSFTKQYESLSKYDTVRIEVRDEAGRTLAVIYHGKVDSLKEIQDLSVPGWDGGPISIVISGYSAGNPNPVYQEEKKYDGTTRKTDTTIVLVHPNPGLSAASLLLQVYEGQSIPLPKVDITPSNLAQTALEWSSSNPQVAQVTGGNLVAGILGSAQVSVKLTAYPGKTLVFEVQVQADPRVPSSLALDRDTLYLAENGAPGGFAIDIKPATASGEVVWTLEDSSIAALRTDGTFQGLKRGKTKAWAAAKAKVSVKDSGFIAVSEPVLVAGVRFLKDQVTLFVGGSPEILAVEVLPAKANPKVTFALTDGSKATLAGDTLTPVAEGSLSVVVRSVEDTTKADTLLVTIEVPVRVTKIEASDAALTLYARGESRTVTATVFPANAPQGVHWISLTSTVASVGLTTGVIQPLKPGLAQVVAVSQADSSKKDTILVSVKEDAPVLIVGNDTAVSAGQTVTFLPSVTQEYGQVVQYKWDLDGNLVWDDSAASIAPKSFKYDQPKEYGARFYVRDTEGNEVVKTRRILVVSGAAVAITSPADNSHTNKKVIPVEWSVNGKKQDSLTSETLAAIGPNTVTRIARDSAGKVFTHSITVHYDTTAPTKPNIAGTSPTNVKPRWTWSPGGGGSGEFRHRLGDGNFPADAPTSRDTAYTLAADPVSGTTYTLFVQERDLAGNWSASASLAIVYDVTQPVVVILSPKASGTHYTSAASLALNGTATGPVAISKVAYKVGAAAAVNASFASGSWSTPALALQEGVATLVTITATDVANNTGEAVVTLFHDNTAPSAPTITNGPGADIAILKGTFAWSAGGDGTSGSGLNGRYRYNLNNGPWKDTSATLLVDLPLAEGNNVFSVQEQDRALLWSASATRVVKTDTTAPTITLTSHANPAASTALTITLSGQVKDTGTGVASMSVGGQVSGSGTVTVNGSAWSTASLTLASGSNTLVLTAIDQVGNSRTLNAVVNVNIPASNVAITFPANNSTLTRNDTVYVHYTIDGTAGRQSFNLAEGANSLVVSSNPNASGNIGRDTVIVTRDATAPNSPNLSAGTTPTQGTASWTWSSRGDNAGGAGMRTPAQFQYQLNGGSWTATTDTRLDLPSPAEGSYSLVVQEQDRAGNWSANSTARTVVVDKTGPTVTITSPASGWITNKGSVLINWTEKDGAAAPVAKSGTFPLPTDNALNTVTVTSSADAAGNTQSATVDIWFRSNVLFVSSGATGGDGSSWSSPLGTVQAALTIANSSSKKQIWMRSGTYTSTGSRGFQLTSGIALYGGFGTTGTPTSITERDSLAPYRTVFTSQNQSDTILYAVSGDYEGNPIRNLVVNSIKLEGNISYGYGGIYFMNVKDFLIANCEFTRFWSYHNEETWDKVSAGALTIWGNGTMRNCNIHHNSGNDPVVNVQPYNWHPGDTGMLLDQGTFSDNSGSAIIMFLNGELTLTKTQMLDYVGEGLQLQSNAPFSSAVVTFRSCTVRGGRDKIFHPGTLNYDGTNTDL